MAHGRRRSFWSRQWLVGSAIASIVTLASFRNADFSAPPRFDGAGYSILAEALLNGRGYREIDHPDAPRHAHFPPGYPIALAGYWRVTGGRSIPAAHAFSVLCTISATLAAWRWFRMMYEPRVAGLLGIALAINWMWDRTAGAIQSEPLFVLLEQFALLAAIRAGRRGGIGQGVLLGVCLGLCILTRQVGVALAVAALFYVIFQSRRATAASALLVTTILVLPWIVWLASVRENTQAELVGKDPAGTARLIGSQVVFYARRLPDQIVGPFVEVGTVFSKSRGLGVAVTCWAAFATFAFLIGWLRTLRTDRRSLAGMTAPATIALLLVWPFTEAGRFLIPLIPCLLIGGVEGISAVLGVVFPKVRRIRRVAAALILAASLPYSLYSLVSNRAEAQRETHADFDSACAWIAAQADSPGPIMTRHPGEVFCQTRRQALAPRAPDPESIAIEVARYHVTFLLVDDERYANAPENPLSRFTREHDRDLKLVWSRPGTGQSSIQIFQVRKSELPR